MDHKALRVGLILSVCVTLTCSQTSPPSGTFSSTSTCTNTSSSCVQVNLTNRGYLIDRFINLRDVKEAYVIKFRIKIYPEVSVQHLQDKGQSDTFDPLTWLWVSRHGSYILDVPMDYRFVSVGLLTLQEHQLDVLLFDQDYCLGNATGKERDAMIRDILSDIIWSSTSLGIRYITYGGETGLDYLCRSVYAYPSFVSPGKSHRVVTGWKCISAEDRMRDKCKDGTVLKKVNQHHQRAMLAFVVLLSIGLFLKCYTAKRIQVVWYAWKGRTWDWVGLYFGHSPSNYRTYILDIGPSDAKRWVHVSDEDLMRTDGKVALAEIGQILGATFHTGRFVVLCRYVFKLVTFIIISVIVIPLVYSEDSNMLSLLKSGEEISINLRSVPLAWWRMKESWATTFGLFVLIGIYIALAIEFIIVIAFVIGFERGPPKDFQRYLADVNRKGRKERTHSVTGLVIAIIFQLVDFCIGIAIVTGIIYPLVQAVAHVCLAVIVYIHLLTPWVVAIAMTLFHVYGNFQQFSQPYIDIKEILQAEILDTEDTIQAYTVWNVFKNKSLRAFKEEDDEAEEGDNNIETEKTVNRIQKLPPRLLSTLMVTFQQEKRPTLLVEHYYKICRYLISNSEALWKFTVRLVLFMVYLAVIMTSITLYRSSMTGDRSSEGLVKGAVVFMFLLLPQLYTLQRGRFKSITSRMIWRLDIQRYLKTLETDWDGEFDSTEAKLRAALSLKRRKERWSVILEDDDVNPDPPLEFPDKVPEDMINHHDTGLNDVKTWSPKMSESEESDVFDENSIRPLPAVGGSEPTIHQKSRSAKDLSLSMGNISNFSSTTT